MTSARLILKEELTDFANAVVEFLDDISGGDDWAKKRIEEDEWCRDEYGICLVCANGASHDADCPIKRLTGDQQ